MSQKSFLSETNLLVAKVLNFCALPLATNLGTLCEAIGLPSTRAKGLFCSVKQGFAA